MKLATFRQPDSDAAYPGATFAAVITSVHPEDPEVAVRAVALPDCRDVGEYLTATPEEQREMVEGALRAAQADRSLLLDTSGLVYDTLVPFPTKVFCVGLNYTNHIDETGLDRPEHPTLFAKFPQSLTGALDPIEVPEEDHRVDYEGELCIVVGEPGRRIAVEDAPEHIAGYAVANDISMRGFQGRTSEWLQGKVWEASTPVGPWLVTPEEFPADARVLTHVNGELRQEDRVADVVFSPAELVSYASQLITLNPGGRNGRSRCSRGDANRGPRRGIRPDGPGREGQRVSTGRAKMSSPTTGSPEDSSRTISSRSTVPSAWVRSATKPGPDWRMRSTAV